MNAETRYRLQLAHDYVAHGKRKFVGCRAVEAIKELRGLLASQSAESIIGFFETPAIRMWADDLLRAALWEPERLLLVARGLSGPRDADESTHMSRGAAPKLLMLYGTFRNLRPTLGDLRKAWPQYYSKPKKLAWPGDKYTRKLFKSFEIPLRRGKPGRPRNRRTKS